MGCGGSWKKQKQKSSKPRRGVGSVAPPRPLLSTLAPRTPRAPQPGHTVQSAWDMPLCHQTNLMTAKANKGNKTVRLCEWVLAQHLEGLLRSSFPELLFPEAPGSRNVVLAGPPPGKVRASAPRAQAPSTEGRVEALLDSQLSCKDQGPSASGCTGTPANKGLQAPPQSP